MEDRIMTKNIIIKSLVNGIMGWIIVALIFSLKRPDMTFVQGLTSMYPIYMGIAGFAGSLIGFSIRKNKDQNI